MGRKMTDAEKFIKSKEVTKQMIESFKQLVTTREQGTYIAPMYVPHIKKTIPDKKMAINMNGYRNRNFILSNMYKATFKEWMEDQLDGVVHNGPLSIKYVIYYARKCDGMNVASVVSKFFLDSLVEYKCIEDDNLDIIVSESWEVGGKVKEPYVKIILEYK